ncbi:UNVERIFIED_CONTAM: translocation protein S66 [Siphonaria sp. JEL0065]|nr:translocation protein S66 [Siphonaria sp. JEL0065]
MSTYFPDHMPKRQYQELAEMYSPKDAQGWGNKILMQALIRRAIVDVQRILQIREEKPQLQNLVRSGVVGEDMLENITLAEKEIELECQDVVAEAELYRDGWGQNIFQEAQAILQQQAQLQAQAAQQAAQQQQAAKPQEQPKSASAGSPPEPLDTNDSLEDLPELVSDEELRKRADQAAAELIAEEEKKKGGKGKKK